MEKLNREVELWVAVRRFKKTFDELCVACSIPPTSSFEELEGIEHSSYDECSQALLEPKRHRFELQRLVRVDQLYAWFNNHSSSKAEALMDQLGEAGDNMTQCAQRLISNLTDPLEQGVFLFFVLKGIGIKFFKNIQKRSFCIFYCKYIKRFHPNIFIQTKRF